MVQTIPEQLRQASAVHPDLAALRYAEESGRQVITYRELFERVDRFARGLVALGVRPGDRVLHLADNSWRWIVADLGIMTAGAVSVPRGADTTTQEAAYILEHSEAMDVIVDEPKLLDLLPEGGGGLRNRIVLTGEAEGTISIAQLEERAEGAELPADGHELATIVYTSGTTGTPKGVMLTHGNILHNVRWLIELIGVTTTDRFLSVLPSWHMFERTAEYTVLASGATLSYSSLRTLRDDMRQEGPTFIVAVPRLYEAMYEGFRGKLDAKSGVAKFIAKFFLNRALSWDGHKLNLRRQVEDPRREGPPPSRLLAALGVVVAAPLGALGRKIVGGPLRAAMGGRLIGAVSGGGMLPLTLDRFLHALGVPIMVGYGLTETSPCVTVRPFEDNVLGTIGRALPETELRVRGPSGHEVGLREQGELEIKGPQVMQGYYRNESATAGVLDEDGWFRTGDLVRMTEKGDIVFCGREKETIVLSGGENIEPYPIEARLLESPLIKQALVVGQNRKVLGALLVPDLERTKKAAEEGGASVEDLMRQEVSRLVTAQAGFKARERVSKIAVLDEEFTVEDGTMTRTLKLRRKAILDKHEAVIDSLYE